MMNVLETIAIRCPYCGEHIDVTVEATLVRQVYIEDCMVCCRPIRLAISVNEESELSIVAARDDE